MTSKIAIKTITPAQVLTCVFVLALIALVVIPRQSQALTVTPRVEINADPGSVVQTELRISNEEQSSQTFYLRYENFNSEDESGTPRFSDRREGLATWLEAQEQVTIGPGETIDIPLTMTIPADAEPGGHFAAVFFLDSPDAELGEVAITSKLGTLLLLRVNGDFIQDANILEFHTVGKKSAFRALPVGFYYRFQNTGDDHLKPVGDVQIKNMFGKLTKILPANPMDGSVLPKSVRRFQSVWFMRRGPLKQEPMPDMPDERNLPYWDEVRYQMKNLAFGRYTADLKLAFGTKELKSDSARLVFWVIPWHLLSVAIPALIILIIGGRFGIKRYNRYIINKAQRERSARRTLTKKTK